MCHLPPVPAASAAHTNYLFKPLISMCHLPPVPAASAAL